MSKGCCLKCLWNFFCCGCCRKTSLQIIDETTLLLPKNEKNKNIIEKTQLNCFGAVPFNSRDINGSVKKIVCGLSHCLLLIKENNIKNLYGFGLNDEGQLGIEVKNAPQENQENFYKINIPQNIINNPNFKIADIAAGDNFSLVLIKEILENQNENSVYHLLKFGINEKEKFRFGILSKVYISELVLPENNMQIKHIYAFGKRMIIQKKNIENKEFLYLGGIDFSGFELEQFQPLKFFLQNNEKIFLDKKIKSISLGVNHCIILDNENNLYGIGDNTYGELGNSNVNIDYFSLLDKNNLESIWLKNTDPKKNLKKKDFQIKKVVCGSRHTLILSSDGKIFCLGDNSENQCYGLNTRIQRPIKLELGIEKEIIDVYAGYTHNLIIINNNNKEEVLTWGDATSGKLGYNEDHLSQSIPKEILALKEKCVNYVCLGFQMSIIVTGSSKKALFKK